MSTEFVHGCWKFIAAGGPPTSHCESFMAVGNGCWKQPWLLEMAVGNSWLLEIHRRRGAADQPLCHCESSDWGSRRADILRS